MAKPFLTADEVIAALGISKGTLYSYVSRGLIQSEEIGGKSRARRYNGDDVWRLQQRQVQRRDPAHAAATALFFGDPVLESAITLIADGQLYYRGRNALALAASCHFEQVALILWSKEWGQAENLPMPAVAAPQERLMLPPAVGQQVTDLLEQGHVAEALQLALITVAPADLAAYQRTPEAVVQTALRLLTLVTGLFTNALATQPAQPAPTIAQQLQECWLPTKPASVRLLDAALILCADHELNASSFTARCVASTGATPYAAVVAALAALQGYKHGGATEEVAILLREAQLDPERAVRERLRQGKAIPGFGHQLYPQGDPRAKMLLKMAREAGAHAPTVDDALMDSEWVAIADTLIAMTKQATQREPNLDFSLVVLARALGLPHHAPFSLFALGRTAGWIGHIIEQYALDRLIRPRAHYTGLPPVQ